ncbi:hypothetical protein WJX84_010252 [Apatococcus fuscideae]|uniref:Uncharacterized protein n=1 Tax=Apatococcus fuscideae TaxID=2026836 RepID=A0AAW1T3W6_9CHLO
MQTLERSAPSSIQLVRSCFLRDRWQAQQACLYATKKRHPVPVPETFEEKETWKTKLIRILTDASEPLTSQAVWLKAEPEGFRSKRHMKGLLDDMRRRGVLKTEPNVVNKSFGYKIGKLPRGFRPGTVASEPASSNQAAPADLTAAQRSWFTRG